MARLPAKKAASSPKKATVRSASKRKVVPRQLVNIGKDAVKPQKKAPAKKVTKKAPKKSAIKKKTVQKKKAPAKKGVRGAVKSKADRKTKPTYPVMVELAIRSSLKRTGLTCTSIGTWIHANYPVPDNFRIYVKKTVHSMKDDGKLVANGVHYRNAITVSKKKKVPAKKAKKAVPKKGVSAKKASPKKAARKPAPKKKAAPTRTKKGKVPAKKGRKQAKVVENVIQGDIPEGEINQVEGEGKWQYNHNGWKDWDPEAGKSVEEAWKEYNEDPDMFDVRSVKSGSWEYMVDFRNMKQTNIQHEAHTVRDLRRVPV